MFSSHQAPETFSLSTSNVEDKIESALTFVMFNLTCAYGMYPGRPLRILGLVILLFSVLYIVAFNRYEGGGIWAVAHRERVRKRKVKGDPMVRLTVRSLTRKIQKDLLARSWMLVPLREGLKIMWTALYFSVLATFAIGWRDLSVGNWIERMQTGEYSLRATGWVRAVSGIQAVISVYLLALSVLTYFGRPFE